MKTHPSKPSNTTRDHAGEISLLAYHLWQQSGCLAGQDVHFWLQAERQLLGRPEKAGARPPISRSSKTLTASARPAKSPSARRSRAL